jgi:prepilin signal peptidase PulO-like enzyme (type II secretory pathway)
MLIYFLISCFNWGGGEGAYRYCISSYSVQCSLNPGLNCIRAVIVWKMQLNVEWILILYANGFQVFILKSNQLNC